MSAAILLFACLTITAGLLVWMLWMDIADAKSSDRPTPPIPTFDQHAEEAIRMIREHL